jgi:hypothetical protein
LTSEVSIVHNVRSPDNANLKWTMRTMLTSEVSILNKANLAVFGQYDNANLEVSIVRIVRKTAKTCCLDFALYVLTRLPIDIMSRMVPQVGVVRIVRSRSALSTMLTWQVSIVALSR